MSNGRLYFSHDYNSRNDPRLVRLQMKLGMEGIGIYWCIVEMLYEEGGYILRNEYERITFELRTKYDIITSVIQDYDLFKFDDERFWSESAIKRLKERANKSDKARVSIGKRWEKYERNTNVLQTKNKRNTIKDKDKDKYIGGNPREFYDKQLELSCNDVNYKTYIDALYGKNKANIKLDGVLSLQRQLDYEHFKELLQRFKAVSKSLLQYTLDIENGGYYKKRKDLYLIYNKWLLKDEQQ